MDTRYECQFVQALALTILTETLILFLVLRLVLRKRVAPIQPQLIVFAGIFASLATLPYLWFVLPAWLSTRTVLLVVGELLVVVVEATFYRMVLVASTGHAALLSVACNTASVLAGLVVTRL